MTLGERIPLSTLTTLKVGGPALVVAECKNVEDIKAAIALARDRGLSWRVLGGGSNVLAADSGYEGVVIRLVPPESEQQARAITFEDQNAHVMAIAEAGVVWDSFVTAAAVQGLWGIENLAGIPGSVGAAPVQNIGAYGTEVKDTLAWVEVLDTTTLESRRIENTECEFDYRESRFKHDRSLIILRAAFSLKRDGTANASYKDLAAKVAAGADFSTPQQVGDAVRSIRAQKFPDLKICGTAGSFFKNPIISNQAYEELKQKYPELPGFSAEDQMKISLAWLLDNVLDMRGFSEGHIRLFERQPLVLVAEEGANAEEIDRFARMIESRVLDATGIIVEREVQSFS